MSTDPYTRRIARIIRVVDGDTFYADIDLGYHTIAANIEFRVAVIDTPELSSKDPTVHLAAVEATIAVKDWLALHETHGGLFVTSTKTDNWKRYLAAVSCGDITHPDLSAYLLMTGHAIPWKR